MGRKEGRKEDRVAPPSFRNQDVVVNVWTTMRGVSTASHIAPLGTGDPPPLTSIARFTQEISATDADADGSKRAGSVLFWNGQTRSRVVGYGITILWPCCDIYTGCKRMQPSFQLCYCCLVITQSPRHRPRSQVDWTGNWFTVLALALNMCPIGRAG